MLRWYAYKKESKMNIKKIKRRNFLWFNNLPFSMPIINARTNKIDKNCWIEKNPNRVVSFLMGARKITAIERKETNLKILIL